MRHWFGKLSATYASNRHATPIEIFLPMLCRHEPSAIYRGTALSSEQHIGDAMSMLSPTCSICYLHPVIRQHNKSDLLFIHDIIWQPQGISPPFMLYTKDQRPSPILKIHR